MTAAQAFRETDHLQRSDDEALARLIGADADLFVLASLDDCVPCTLMKPIVRQPASRHSVELRFAEPQTTSWARRRRRSLFGSSSTRRRLRSIRSMAPASAALAPFMAAAGAGLQALETRLRAIETTGEMTIEAASRLRRNEQTRIYSPFQDRIDALREVQASAMRLYAEKTDWAVPTHAPFPAGSKPTLVCGPGGAVCSLVAVGQDETT